MENKRTGGGECRAGAGSTRKIFALSTKKLAYARATALGLEPSSEICRWYGVISCCIQRANAKILRGEPVQGRHATPVPGGMFSLGRDLRLVTG